MCVYINLLHNIKDLKCKTTVSEKVITYKNSIMRLIKELQLQ